jgi:hypothetical protein
VSQAVISSPDVGATHRRPPTWVFVVAPLTAALLVTIATRHDPLMSPDSITYLSVADHVRAGRGLTDFTGKPMAVFGPVYPLVLAVGGRGLLWARIVGVVAIAAGTLLMGLVLQRRVRVLMAVAGALAFGASQGFVHIASLVWSEAPYAAIALGMILVLARGTITTRTAVIAGLLGGLGFLTRYAGAGLLMTGAVMVAVATLQEGDRSKIVRPLGAFAGAAVAITSLWIIRNLVETGQPLGPRFEGGAGEPLTQTIRLAFIGIGDIVVGDGPSVESFARVGTVVVIVIALLAVFALRSRKELTLDAGMATFAATAFVIPIIARIATANDIEMRVMSPIVIPLIYFVIVAFDRVCTTRAMAVIGTAVLAWWIYQGVALAVRFPDRAPTGSAYKPQFSPELYDAIDALPADARILTNNPQRVWWFTDREPTQMGFTRPRPGNSHYPIDAVDTLKEACTGHTYLAWFNGLLNAGITPQERRPDLAALVDLKFQTSVPGGQLYFLAPVDPTSCRQG